MTTIKQIKKECRDIIAQAEKATPGPWEKGTLPLPKKVFHNGDHSVVPPIGFNGPVCISHGKNEAKFIASSRSFTPKAAKALLVAICAIEDQKARFHIEGFATGEQVMFEALKTIRASWEESK